MTDNEIIKALEYCSGDKVCSDGCPFKDKCCKDLDFLEKACLDLINRQKAEIERLQKEGLVLNKIFMSFVNKEKFEAIKEFAERLKVIFNFGVRVYEGKCSVDGVVHNIDNLVKEMEGEKHG